MISPSLSRQQVFMLGLMLLPAKASLVKGRNAELAIMLDISNSMNIDLKLDSMKSAVNGFIDMLFLGSNEGDQQNPPSVRISLVPYNSFVNVGSEIWSKVTTTESDYTNDTCVMERLGNYSYTDDPPNPEYGYFSTYESVYGTEYGSCLNPYPIMPLTSNHSVLKSHVNSLTAHLSTAGHVGIGWCFYTLSPKWTGIWPTDSAPGNYLDDNTNKIAILLTDTDFNTRVPTNPTLAFQQAELICQNMKTAGIIIYGIAFDVSVDSPAAETMQNCSSSLKHYYYSKFNEDGLQLVYEEIASMILDGDEQTSESTSPTITPSKEEA